MSHRAGMTLRRLRKELAGSLFLPSSPQAARLGGSEAVLLLVAFVALAVVLQVLRVGPANAAHGLWAEDGSIFLAGGLSHGFLTDVFAPYAEYLVVVPRLIGEVGAAVPLLRAPLMMSVAAALVVAASGVAVWSSSAAHITNTVLRAALVASMVLTPVGGETAASTANVAWHMAFAVFLLLCWRPTTRRGAWLSAGFILATCLSTPATFFFVPLALLRALAIRDRRDGLIVGAFALGTAIQIPVTALTSEHVSADVWTSNIFTNFLQRVVDGAVFGVELGGSIWVDGGWAFLIAISLAVAVVLTVLMLRATSGRLFAAIAIATAIVMFFASSYNRGVGDSMAWSADFPAGNGGRYAVVPVLLTISAALAMLDSRLRAAANRRLAWAAIAFTAGLMTLAIVTSFDTHQGANRGGPPWDQSLDDAAARCQGKGLTEVVVPTAPEGWTMVLPCNRVP